MMSARSRQWRGAMALAAVCSLAQSVEAHNGSRVYPIMELSDGADLHSLTDTPSLSELTPAWSPDGRYLAYPVQEIVDDSVSMQIRWLDTATLAGGVAEDLPGPA